jgi:TonB family protein
MKITHILAAHLLLFLPFSGIGQNSQPVDKEIKKSSSVEPGILEIFHYRNEGEQMDYSPYKKQYWIFKNSGEISRNTTNLIIQTVFNDGLAMAYDPITKKDLFIDENFKKVIEFSKGYQFTNFNDGVAWVKKEKSDPYLINKKNEILARCKGCSQVNVYSEGMAAFRDKRGQWGFLDKFGNTLFKLPKNIFYVSKFSSGMAQYYIYEPNSDKIKFGYINKAGKNAIKPIFNYSEDYGGIDQLTNGDDDEKNKFIGEYAYIFEYKTDPSSATDSSPIFESYLITKKGEIITDSLAIQKFENSVDEKESTTEELIPQKQKNKIGYVNSSNKFILKPIYDEGSEFSNGIADVSIGKKNYIISKTGKIIFEYPKDKDLTRVTFYTKPSFEYVEGQGLRVINVIKNTPEEVKGNTASETVKGDTEYYEPAIDPDAKGPEPATKPAEDEIFTAVEQNAEFPGGPRAFEAFLRENLRYPSAAQRANVGGKVYIQFVVNTDGSIQDVQILRSVGFGCDEEAIRLIKAVPRWTPGKQSGRKVRARFTQPITFILPETINLKENESGDKIVLPYNLSDYNAKEIELKSQEIEVKKEEGPVKISPFLNLQNIRKGLKIIE